MDTTTEIPEKIEIIEIYKKRFPTLLEDQLELYYELWYLYKSKSQAKSEFSDDISPHTSSNIGSSAKDMQDSMGDTLENSSTSTRTTKKGSGFSILGKSKSLSHLKETDQDKTESNGKRTSLLLSNKGDVKKDTKGKQDRSTLICSYEELDDICNWGEDKDMLLLRYLQAEKYNIDKTIDHLALTLAWRRKEKVNELRNKPVSDILSCTEDELRKYYPRAITGFDKLGRPIIIQKFSAFEVWNIKKITPLESVIKHHIWEQEHTCALLYSQSLKHKRNISQFCIIIDIENMAISTVTSDFLFLVKSIASIDQNHYPERMGSTYIINCPTVFPMVWNIVKHWLDTKTTSKIHILKGKDEWLPVFEENFDLDQLPEEYGGTQKSFFSPRESLFHQLHPNLLADPKATVPIFTSTNPTEVPKNSGAPNTSTVIPSASRSPTPPSSSSALLSMKNEKNQKNEDSLRNTNDFTPALDFMEEDEKLSLSSIEIESKTSTSSIEPEIPKGTSVPVETEITTSISKETQISLGNGAIEIEPTTSTSSNKPELSTGTVEGGKETKSTCTSPTETQNINHTFINDPFINPGKSFEPFGSPQSDEVNEESDSVRNNYVPNLNIGASLPSVEVPSMKDISQQAKESISSLVDGVDSSVNTASSFLNSMVSKQTSTTKAKKPITGSESTEESLNSTFSSMAFSFPTFTTTDQESTTKIKTEEKKKDDPSKISTKQEESQEDSSTIFTIPTFPKPW